MSGGDDDDKWEGGREFKNLRKCVGIVKEHFYERENAASGGGSGSGSGGKRGQVAEGGKKPKKNSSFAPLVSANGLSFGFLNF